MVVPEVEPAVLLPVEPDVVEPAVVPEVELIEPEVLPLVVWPCAALVARPRPSRKAAVRNGRAILFFIACGRKRLKKGPDNYIMPTGQ
jgi:hypothetical protein